jgi:predicted membrane channel-forming protein YqfA (hemolysin III family)
MSSILERIRSVPPRALVLATVVALLVGAALVAVLSTPKTLLGLLGLAAYVVGVLLFSAGITFAVVRISPSQSAKEQAGDST